MFLQRTALPARSHREIWVEELLGPALPVRGKRREALMAQLLADGGDGAFKALRGGIGITASGRQRQR